MPPSCRLQLSRFSQGTLMVDRSGLTRQVRAGIHCRRICPCSGANAWDCCVPRECGASGPRCQIRCQALVPGEPVDRGDSSITRKAHRLLIVCGPSLHKAMPCERRTLHLVLQTPVVWELAWIFAMHVKIDTHTCCAGAGTAPRQRCCRCRTGCRVCSQPLHCSHPC